MAQPVIGTPWQKLDHAVPAEELELSLIHI